MHRKSRNLSAEDCRALDLILDHGAAHQGRVTHAPSGVPERRVAAAARLLSVLGTCPMIEPPDDLLARTMARIDAARHHPVTETTATRAAMVH